MQITLKEITVGELANGYEDNAEGGVVAFGGKLDVRPPYQREFVYKDKQRDAVVNTVTKNFPLNVMYWAVREDGNFEVIDGQQRTISICQYVKGDFSFQNLYFHNLPDDKKEQILNYKLMIYRCTGTDSEKLDWFRTINIAGEEHTEQELRNAVYAGSWLSDAKRYFSKTGCAAYQIGQDYLDGIPIRQDYLETAIDWISKARGGSDIIEKYMGKHQRDANAKPLWNYFQKVMDWVEATFTKKRKFMKGVAWGTLYNEYKGKKFNAEEIEAETAKLIADDDVTNKKGIYTYLLTGEEKYLNIRAFTDSQKQKAYERQNGHCPKCPKTKHWQLDEMEADHITPWREGGKTTAENCQMLCKDDNRRKSAK
jgi:hypothetical protein